MSFHFRFLFFCTILFVITIIDAHHPSIVSLPSGRKISSTIIVQHFPTSSIDSALKRFYEITNDYRVIGYDLNISIYEETGHSEKIQHSKPQTILVDGVQSESLHGDVFIRQGSHYHLGHKHDGTVLAMWGPGVALQPVDLINHPTLYINTVTSEKITSHMTVDHLLNDDDDLKQLVSKDRNLIDDEETFITEIIDVDSQSKTKPIYLKNIAPIIDYASTTTTTTRQSSSSFPPCYAGTKTKQVKIAAAFSHKLCKKYGGYKNTQQAILSAVALASKPYEKQTCLFLSVTAFDGYCKRSIDPYRNYSRMYVDTSPAQVKMLTDFRTFWRTNRWRVKRDLAYFFPAFIDTYPILGITFMGGICSRRTGYGWVEGLYPNVLAHEIGHNLNAKHSSNGLMSAALDPKQKSFQFSTFSANVIRSYARSKICLTQKQTPYQALPPTRNANTCGKKMRKNIGFSCSSKHFRQIVGHSLRATIQTFVQVKNDQITLFLWLKKRNGSSQNVRLRRVLIYISTDKSIKTLTQLKTLAPLQRIRGNQKSVAKRFSVSKQPANKKWGSCCGKEISLYVYVEIQKYGTVLLQNFEFGAYRFGWKLNCKKCKNNIRPMNAAWACPKCS